MVKLKQTYCYDLTRVYLYIFIGARYFKPAPKGYADWKLPLKFAFLTGFQFLNLNSEPIKNCNSTKSTKY